MEWLVARMPERDRTEIDAAFLLEHVDEAHRAWQSAPWREMVPREIFLDAILPYASISERRDAWRDPIRELAAPIASGASTPAEAAIRLNQQIFSKTGVKYSTKRRRADQSSAESIEQGLASCSGLSILLIDACRSVGVPARFVGVPLWTDGSGNHSWVEIWDGERSRFTGAAEPTGDRLDEAWFTERARTAIAGDPRHGIYAVSWGDSPLPFPMSFDGKPSPSRAIDVTERYLASATPLPEGHGRMRIRVRDGEQRVATGVVVAAPDGTVLFEGVSKDDRFDANDHLFATLPIGTVFTVSTEGGLPVAGTLEGESMLVDLSIEPEAAVAEPIAAASSASPDPKASRTAVNALARTLRADGFDAASTGDFANVPLTEEDVARAARVLVDAWQRKVKRERMSALREGVVEIDGLRMPIWYQAYGEKPKGGRSLFISMHGGGGAPPEVNSQQWENQKRLYRPAEGVYLAPRAPTDTWNLWHQGHIDRFFDRLIADLVVIEGVDPDRVYLMGYSAGGDGVYQLAPRMADRFAAAAMMAGHPNETKPDGLRNLPFALWMGGNDGAYNRNGVARQWGEALGRSQRRIRAAIRTRSGSSRARATGWIARMPRRCRGWRPMRGTFDRRRSFGCRTTWCTPASTGSRSASPRSARRWWPRATASGSRSTHGCRRANCGCGSTTRCSISTRRSSSCKASRNSSEAVCRERSPRSRRPSQNAAIPRASSAARSR